MIEAKLDVLDEADLIACEVADTDEIHISKLGDRIRSYGEQCRRAGAEAVREAAAKVLENGSFLHDKSPSAIWAKQIAALIRALPSAAEAASPAAGWRIPDGWKLVPIEATAAMLRAAELYQAPPGATLRTRTEVAEYWRCMLRAVLAAAPSPSEEARAG